MDTFILPPQLRKITVDNPESILGHYVYTLLDNEELFFVGSGQKRRAYNFHSQEVEEIKLISRNYQVEIIKDGLTQTQARSLVKQLIVLHFSQGKNLVNKRVFSLPS